MDLGLGYPGTSCLYAFSGPIVLVLGWRDRGGFAWMEEGGTEKASGGRFARVARETDEDEGRGRARLGHGANRILVPGYDHPVPPGRRPFAHRRASH
jgi:hypothetical protein